MYLHIQVYTGNYYLTACFPNINFPFHTFAYKKQRSFTFSLVKWKQIHESNEALRVGSFYHMHLWKICFGFSIMSFKQWYVNCLGTELCLFKCSLQRAELDATGRIRYLGSTVSSFAHTESNEDWVSHFDQYVVYTIDMDIFDPSGLHILQYTTFMQSPVQASITIYWSQISKQPWPFII